MANKTIVNFLDTVEALILGYAVGKVSHNAAQTWSDTRNAIETAAAEGATEEIVNKINQK